YLQVLRRISEQEVRRPREADPSVDADLEALLLKALAPDPERRYASAGGLAEDITRYLCGDPLSAKPATLPYVLGKRLRRHRLVFAASACALLTLGGLTGYGVVRINRERASALAAKASAVAAKDEAVTSKV